MADIFSQVRLSPSQARTVAQRRFDDAEWLRKSGDNARANGVFYLGGLVVDCLLKAALLERHRDLQTPVTLDQLSAHDRRVWSLIYRSHELEEMLAHLPDLERRLQAKDLKDGSDLLRKLRSICAKWTVYARYSPRTETMKHAAEFLDHVREVKEWLR